MRYYWLLALIVIMCGGMLFAAAGDEHTFELKWKSDGFYENQIVQFDQSVPFDLEPELSKGIVFRGILSLGTGDYRERTGFVWDPDVGKLYVDINRDGDLTNDPDGVLETDDVLDRDYQIGFPEFELSLKTNNGVHRYRISASMYDYSSSRYAYFSIRSGYAGNVDLNEKIYHFRVVDPLHGVVRQGNRLWVNPLNAGGNGIDGIPAPQTLFFNGRCYDLSFTFKPGDDQTPRLWCTLTEKDVPLDTLHLEGSNISRLVLSDEKMLVIPDLSEQEMTVPVGNFGCCSLELKVDESRTAMPQNLNDISSVSIMKDGDNILKVGGPLNHQVDIERTGRILEFRYQLVGIGGEIYDAQQISNYNPSQYPSVSIYKGDMQLATGEFEYG